MHILSLSVREFGGLKDLSVTLGDDLNLIEGSNESGKSTLLAFIRFLFYGLRPRSAGEELSDADRAYSWKSGTASGGMTLSFGGSVYRIERHEHLGNPEKHLLIVNETTGKTYTTKPFPPFIAQIIADGGLMESIKKGNF